MFARWSRDGARLVFRTNRKGGLIDIYEKSAAGGGEERVLSWETQVAAGVRSVTLATAD